MTVEMPYTGTASGGDHVFATTTLRGGRLEHQLVDSCAMRLVTAPNSFDVIAHVTSAVPVNSGVVTLCPKRGW